MKIVLCSSSTCSTNAVVEPDVTRVLSPDLTAAVDVLAAVQVLEQSSQQQRGGSRPVRMREDRSDVNSLATVRASLPVRP